MEPNRARLAALRVERLPELPGRYELEVLDLRKLQQCGVTGDEHLRLARKGFGEHQRVVGIDDRRYGLDFAHDQGCLARDESALSYAEIAQRLKITEPAVKMAVQRLRARYRELLEDEIAQTVSSAAEVEQELRHLFSVFES